MAAGAPAAAFAPHANNPRTTRNGQLVRSIDTIGFGRCTTRRGVAVHNQQQHFGALPSHRASQSPPLKPSGEFVDMEGARQLPDQEARRAQETIAKLEQREASQRDGIAAESPKTLQASHSMSESWWPLC